MMVPAHCCHGSHGRQKRTSGRPCPACRLELVAGRVAEADPTLPAAVVTEALEATITNPAVLRDLAKALTPGSQALLTGAGSVTTTV